MKKPIASFLLLCVFLFCSFAAPPAAAADVPYFTFYADKSVVVANDEVRIKVNANENDLAENIAAFRVIVHFDSSKMTIKRADTSSQVQQDAFQYHVQGDDIIGIYACDGKTAPKLFGDCITFVFSVQEGATVGETIVAAQIDQMVDWGIHKLSTVCSGEVKLQIAPPLSPKALLASLEPLQGTLEPSFSPNIAAYHLNLPSSVTTIEFHASAAEGGIVSINRKTLGKAGTNTIITITVTSADKKSKSQYFVTVSRAAKLTAEASGSQGRTGSVSSDISSKKQAVQSGTRSASALSAVSAPQTKEAANQGDRNLYIVGNQMPAYMVGMLAAGLCMLVGILAFVVLKKDKNNKQ